MSQSDEGTERMAEADADIIRAVLSGEVDRYAALVERYQAPTIRVAFSLLGNCEEARDVAQEAWVSAYRALGHFRGRAKFSTWLYRIVINKCKDASKRRARQPAIVGRVGWSDASMDATETLFVDPEDPTANPSDHAANHELSRQLSAAIGTLSGHQLTVFVLHHLHGLTLEAVAETLGCRVGTVKSHLFRATKQLRRQLTPWLRSETVAHA